MGEHANFYQTFLAQHQLPEGYAESARRYFEPVARRLIELQTSANKPYFVALNGCQGSGKTTLADYLKHWLETQGKRAISISLDDFYLTKAERFELSERVHPLFRVRGVPGTHDTALMVEVLSSLAVGKEVSIPRFNKATDDRVAPSDWTQVQGFVDFILMEGWCWGARHQTEEVLETPVNTLESERDETGIWRRYVNDTLAADYEPLYSFMDCWLMLKAPSFGCVYQWRLEQENKLRAKLGSDVSSVSLNPAVSGLMTPEQVAEFVQFYQRITEALLTRLPDRADVVWTLDANRQIQSCRTNHSFTSLNEQGNNYPISHSEGENL